ncbi:uncharacterized protein LOC129586583 isoform X2 [Paramacrobiotus metropolitanus]|uniref:uncharacterized protein LOC129586583 isoform X2 n=1 Tax=Paramacrobiotus metropolitanus TaxID=2943436 RepID=UPI002445EF72|nr:uncharacterized protein LOC129586583 isoform X2 [Paramacrobiotus metropolitanus]
MALLYLLISGIVSSVSSYVIVPEEGLPNTPPVITVEDAGYKIKVREQYTYTHPGSVWSINIYQDFENPHSYFNEPAFTEGLPLCPKDGWPNCENCNFVSKNDFQNGGNGHPWVLAQCCATHHYARTRKLALQNIYPYAFFGKSLGTITNPNGDIYLNKENDFYTWTDDPCTGEYLWSIPKPYVPLRVRNMPVTVAPTTPTTTAVRCETYAQPCR